MQAASSISLAGVLPQASTSYLYSTGTCGCNTLFINVSTMEVLTTESNFPTCHIRTLDVSSWTSGRLTFLHGTQNQASKGGQAAGWLDIEHSRLRKQTTIGLQGDSILHRTCPEGLAFCPLAIQSMDGIFTYIWFVFMVNVGKYTPHGCIGLIITSLTTHNGKFVGKVDNELSKASHTHKQDLGCAPEKLHHQPQSL